MTIATPDYGYKGAQHSHAHAYLLPVVDHVLTQVDARRVFDLGCGNGSVANHLARRHDVKGIDASASGIAAAKLNYPALDLAQGSVYDDLAAEYGAFDAVISIEVVEHLYDPKLYARRLFDLVRPGGSIVVSTPYHGYFKNLALAVSGKMDKHFTALWDGGHIKFWSVKTLTALLTQAGFVDIRFHFVGRVPLLAKSMIAVARRREA